MPKRETPVSTTPVEVALRQHQAERVERLIPNFADGDDLHDFVREELRGPLAELFSIRDQIRVLQRSDAFGSCLNYQKAVADVLSGVDAIEAQLRRLWEAG
jgi:hypothetical protein